MRYIFLDRDGTIIKNKPHQYKIEDLEFLPGALSGLKKIQGLGYDFIIVTNQSVIARGDCNEEDVIRFNNELESRLLQNDITVMRTLLCPHHPDFTGTCSCRKPEPGMAERAAKEFGIDLTTSFFVGDSERDIGLGNACGGRTFFIEGQYDTTIEPDHRARDLEDVFKLLKKHYAQ